jgi:hypothetical protein
MFYSSQVQLRILAAIHLHQEERKHKSRRAGIDRTIADAREEHTSPSTGRTTECSTMKRLLRDDLRSGSAFSGGNDVDGRVILLNILAAAMLADRLRTFLMLCDRCKHSERLLTVFAEVFVGWHMHFSFG